MTAMASNTSAKDDVPSGSGGIRGFVATHSQWISLVMRVLLAVMWFAYSVPKLSEPSDKNVQAVRNFRLLPESLVPTWGYAQPWLEIAFGLLLIIGLGTRLVALFSVLLLLVYIGGIISLPLRDIYISCGCGGSGGVVDKSQVHYTRDVFRDIAFMIPALWLLWKPASKFSAERALLGDPIE
jgi:uncharacterized membrane protein YphA (DoxX/SURF4 family)